MTEEPKFKVGDIVRKIGPVFTGYEMKVTLVGSNSIGGIITKAAPGRIVGDRGGDHAKFYEHVKVSTADLIAEKEAVIKECEASITAARAEIARLEAQNIKLGLPYRLGSPAVNDYRYTPVEIYEGRVYGRQEDSRGQGRQAFSFPVVDFCKSYYY